MDQVESLGGVNRYNTVISLLHLAGTTEIARNLRRLARNPEHAITLLTSTSPTLN